MAKELNREAKKILAKELFLSGKHRQKEISKLVCVSENTVGKWIKDGQWEMLRASLTTTKESILAKKYQQLAEIDNAIAERKPGERVPTSKEADIQIKISAVIKNLETETGIAEITSVCTGLCEFVRQYDVKKAQEISDHFQAYIEHKLQS